MATGPVLKIVVIGATGVGKSSIIRRLVNNEFSEDISVTCGADFVCYPCVAGTTPVRMQIWDTAGQERFRAISHSYFRNAVGAILVYGIDSLQSFDELAEWLLNFQRRAAPNASVLLIGNKADLEKGRKVGVNAVAEFVAQNGLEHIETSARTGAGVREAFTRLAVEVYNRIQRNEIESAGTPPSILVTEPASAKKKSCC
jgi:small GTP-binding protein